MIRNEHDLVIVGGGPAGLSLALHLLHRAPRLRSRLIVIEKERYPREKYCAGAIGRRGELALQRIGIHLKIPAVEVGGISVQLPQGRIEATPGAIGRIVRRIEYDHALAEIARRRGVKILEGTKALAIHLADDKITVQTNQGDLQTNAVVGADGVGSMVRKAMGLGRGFWQAQVIEVDTPYVDTDPPRSLLHFDLSDPSLDGYTWNFPTIVNGEELSCRGVYQLQIPGRPPAEDIQERLAKHLMHHGLSLSDCKKKRYAERGFAPHEPSAGPRTLLIGEAAGIDPITGEGIAQALLYGEVAARYLVERIGQQNFSFVDWSTYLKHTKLGLDLQLRHEVSSRYFGPARTFYEATFHDIQDAFSLGVDYFAGKKLNRIRQIRAGIQVLQRAWRERAADPLRPWLGETTLSDTFSRPTSLPKLSQGD